jgi:hypothetical protein
MNLSDMTVSQLRKLAAQFGIPGRSTMKKAELVEALSDPEIADFVALSVTVDAIPADVHMSDHNPDTEGRPAALDITARTTRRRENGNVQIRITKAPHGTARADAVMVMHDFEYEAELVREGRTWTLYDQQGPKRIVIRGGSLEKVAKRWARRLNAWADRIAIFQGV